MGNIKKEKSKNNYKYGRMIHFIKTVKAYRKIMITLYSYIIMI